MMETEIKKRTEEPLLTSQEIEFIIPECCRLGLPSCPHVPKKQKKVKTNIGL